VDTANLFLRQDELVRQTEVDVEVPVGRAIGGSISVTALRRFWRCPLAYWFAYGAGAGKPVSAGEWSMGEVIHGALRRLFSLPPEERRYEALFDLILAEWRTEHPTERFEYLYLARARIANIFSLMDVTRVEVVGTEVPVDMELAGFAVRGRIDLLYRDQAGTNVIADFKSGLRKPRSPLQDPMTTMRTYDLLLSQRYEREDTVTVLELLVLEPPGSERSLPIGAPDRQAHREEVASRLELLAASASTQTWKGRVRPSCQTCAFFRACPAVRSALKPVDPTTRVRISPDDLEALGA